MLHQNGGNRKLRDSRPLAGDLHWTCERRTSGNVRRRRAAPAASSAARPAARSPRGVPAAPRAPRAGSPSTRAPPMQSQRVEHSMSFVRAINSLLIARSTQHHYERWNDTTNTIITITTEHKLKQPQAEIFLVFIVKPAANLGRLSSGTSNKLIIDRVRNRGA